MSEQQLEEFAMKPTSGAAGGMLGHLVAMKKKKKLKGGGAPKRKPKAAPAPAPSYGGGGGY